jgi:hypothetical protein
METVIHFASSGVYRAELLQAREDFFAHLGVVSEEEDKYEEYLRHFLDWYIFDRPLTSSGSTPVSTFFAKFHRTFSNEDEVVYDGFRKSRQSLFIVKKSGDEGVWIRDLISKEKYFVEDDVPKGFFKDEIFQVRLIPFQGGYRFGDAFYFHPQSAKKIIQKRAKKLDREQPEKVNEFLVDLASRRRSSERYRHVDALRFYMEEE